jgi:hypothetical protein
MSDRLVTVARYSVDVEAQLAVGRLQAEGIPAFLSGEWSAGAFSGVSGLGGPMQVQVHEMDLKRARDILATCTADEELDEDWEELAEADVWVCSLCGEPVSSDLSACPACQTPRNALRSDAAHALPRPRQPAALLPEAGIVRRDQLAAGPPPVPEHELAEDGPDLPPAETFLGDDLARRAFRAAVFGCVTLFVVFNLYSLWLLLRAGLFPGQLSPAGMRRLYIALLMNLGVVLLWSAVLGALAR